MAFDPDAFLNDSPSTGFDPDAFLAADVTAETVTPEQYASMSPERRRQLQDQGEAAATQMATDAHAARYTPSDALASGAVQGGSFDLADEAKGVGGAIMRQLQGSDRSVMDDYRTERGIARQDAGQAQAANPVPFATGRVGGAAATALLPGGLVAQGALAGLGSSEADLTRGNIGGAALDTAGGAVIGKAAGLVGNGISALAGRSAAPAAAEAAEAVAPGIKSPFKSDIFGKGISRSEPEAVEGIAGQAVDKLTGFMKKAGGAIGGLSGMAHGGPIGGYVGYKTGQATGETLVPAAKKVVEGAGKLRGVIEAGFSRIPDKYKGVMRSAMERGGNSAAVQHFILSQRDPEYSKAFNATDGANDDETAAKPSMTSGSF